MTKLLVIHGSGMCMRGKTQTEIFGTMTLAEYDTTIRRYAARLGLEIEIFHSNSEGAVIDHLYNAHEEGVDAAIINPDGFTRGYPALVLALGRVRFPTIEVHISNPARRGTQSDVGYREPRHRDRLRHCGYELAMRGSWRC